MSLRARTVMRNVKELLQQLVGAKSQGIYFLDEEERKLVPIASDGVDLATLPIIPVQDGVLGDPVSATIERSFLTGIAHIAEGEAPSPPAACIPLQLEDRVIGAIVVFDLLAQKKRFVTVDRELFKLPAFTGDVRRRLPLHERRRRSADARGPTGTLHVTPNRTKLTPPTNDNPVTSQDETPR